MIRAGGWQRHECERSSLFRFCVLSFVSASYKWFYTLSRAMLAKWFTSLLLFSFWWLWMCVTLYFLPMYVTICPALLCDMISCSCSMYNAYSKLYVTCLSAPQIPHPTPTPQPRVSRHPNAQTLALECFIWPHIRPISARFMTSGVGLFHRIPRQDTIHGCCVCDACSVFKSESHGSVGAPGEL